MYETPYMLSYRDSQIIEAVYQYHYVTVEQVKRLFFGKNSSHYASEYLKRLTDHKYLYRFPLPDSKRGNPQNIYTLATKGINHLKGIGKDHAVYFRPGDTPPSFEHLRHELAVNDFLIAASLLPKTETTITLAEKRHGWQLHHTPLKVRVKDDSITVVGDGWLDFRYSIGNDTYQTAVWLELDRGSEYAKQFRRKIRGLVAAVTSLAYQDQFGTDIVTIAFATSSGESRIHAMREHVLEVLIEMERLKESSMFLFTSLPTELDPKTLFTAPVWQTVQGECVSLLDLS